MWKATWQPLSAAQARTCLPKVVSISTLPATHFLQEAPSHKGSTTFHNDTLGSHRRSHCLGESSLSVTIPPCLCPYNTTSDIPDIHICSREETHFQHRACLSSLSAFTVHYRAQHQWNVLPKGKIHSENPMLYQTLSSQSPSSQEWIKHAQNVKR